MPGRERFNIVMGGRGTAGNRMLGSMDAGKPWSGLVSSDLFLDLGSALYIPGSRFWILGSRFQTPDFGFQKWNLDLENPDPGHLGNPSLDDLDLQINRSIGLLNLLIC